ncbi:MAG: YdcF family protein, partial [Rhodospirillaceae bacterium]|nr:YdcF family protein [Rhodospirillaceae bacterium]
LFATSLEAVVEDQDTVTDAIVVLTGGSERLSRGLALLEAGKARKLFVSGVHKGVDLPELLRQIRPQRPEIPCCIVLGHAADDTTGNAAETAAWMEAEHFSSLRLVTASYHMRRSTLEFRRAMPKVIIIAHPVFPDAFKREQWWRWPGTAHLLATEYTKYLAAQARRLFIPRAPERKP